MASQAQVLPLVKILNFFFDKNIENSFKRAQRSREGCLRLSGVITAVPWRGDATGTKSMN